MFHVNTYSMNLLKDWPTFLLDSNKPKGGGDKSLIMSFCERDLEVRFD